MNTVADSNKQFNGGRSLYPSGRRYCYMLNFGIFPSKSSLIMNFWDGSKSDSSSTLEYSQLCDNFFLFTFYDALVKFYTAGFHLPLHSFSHLLTQAVVLTSHFGSLLSLF